MKIASTVSRYLLGLIFTVFGLNGFLHFIQPPPPPGLAGQFVDVLVASHYMVPVFLLQVACGLLFLANRYVPVALTLIAPVIVNILLYHVLMYPSGIVPGAVATICWWVVFYSVRPAFRGHSPASSSGAREITSGLFSRRAGLRHCLRAATAAPMPIPVVISVAQLVGSLRLEGERSRSRTPTSLPARR